MIRSRLATLALAAGLLIAAPSARSQADASSNQTSTSTTTITRAVTPGGDLPMGSWRGEAYAAAEATQPLRVGELAPTTLTLRTLRDEEIQLGQLAAGRPTVIVFYRGGWCPYCVRHLSDLARIEPQLASASVTLLAVSPDGPTKLAEAQAKQPLPFTRLSDSTHAVMTAFGIAYRVDQPTQEKLQEYGINLAEWSGSPESILPVPAVFVIDPTGRVTFAHANPDYTVRLSGDAVLRAAGIEPQASE